MDITDAINALHGHACNEDGRPYNSNRIESCVEVSGGAIIWNNFDLTFTIKSPDPEIIVPLKIKKVQKQLTLVGDHDLIGRLMDETIKNIDGVECDEFNLSYVVCPTGFTVNAKGFWFGYMKVNDLSICSKARQPGLSFYMTDIESFKNIPKNIGCLTIESCNVDAFDHVPESATAIDFIRLQRAEDKPRIGKIINLCMINGVKSITMKGNTKEMGPLMMLREYIINNDVYGAAAKFIDCGMDEYAEV